MHGVVTGFFVVLFLVWIAAKMMQSAATSNAKAQRKQAEARAYRLRTEALRRTNQMSAEDLDAFEAWKRENG